MKNRLTCEKWLNEPWDDELPFDGVVIPDAPQPTRGQVLTALIGLNNGDMHVSGWGSQVIGDGLYGRIGLSQHEALCLIDLAAYIRGWIDGAGEGPEGLMRVVNVELTRVKALARGGGA